MEQGYATVKGISSPAHVGQPTVEERGAETVTSNERATRRALRKFSGVVEARPGIIESSHIAPLDDDYEVEAGRGRTMGQVAQEQMQSLKERGFAASEGVANVMYGTATGDQKAKKAGKEALGFTM